jgi:hypothetical protein
VYSDDATGVLPPNGLARIGDRAPTTTPHLPTLPDQLERWPGTSWWRSCPACGARGRAQAGPIACTPSGQRAFPYLGPIPGYHDRLAGHGRRGVRRRRRPDPSRGDGTARARLEALAGGAVMIQPRSGHQAIFGDRHSGRSASCCLR